MKLNIKEIEDACTRIDKSIQKLVEQDANEQEKILRNMFEECGYSCEEADRMLRSGEMVCDSGLNTYGFTNPVGVTIYKFYIKGVWACTFVMNDALVKVANSKAGYGISMEVVRSYDYEVHKTRKEIEDEI